MINKGILSSLMLIALSSAIIAKTPIATVTYVIGKSVVESEAKKSLITRGVLLQEGDTITTFKNSEVDVAFANGSSISIDPESTVKLKKYSPKAKGLVSLFQSSGKMRNRVAKGSEYSVETPYGTATAKGTDYTTSIGSGAVIGVVSGIVLVENDKSSYTLLPGYEATISFSAISVTENKSLLQPKQKAKQPEVIITVSQLAKTDMVDSIQYKIGLIGSDATQLEKLNQGSIQVESTNAVQFKEFSGTTGEIKLVDGHALLTLTNISKIKSETRINLTGNDLTPTVIVYSPEKGSSSSDNTSGQKNIRVFFSSKDKELDGTSIIILPKP